MKDKIAGLLLHIVGALLSMRYYTSDRDSLNTKLDDLMKKINLTLDKNKD